MKKIANQELIGKGYWRLILGDDGLTLWGCSKRIFELRTTPISDLKSCYAGSEPIVGAKYFEYQRRGDKVIPIEVEDYNFRRDGSLIINRLEAIYETNEW